MESTTVGRVAVKAKIENFPDLILAEKGIIRPEEVHCLEVEDALVDTGSTYLSMPHRMIEELGFDKPFTTRESQTAAGERTVGIYGPVRLSVQDRFCTVDIAETDDGCPVLIGQVPLELLDFVVDLKGQRLVGNPRHGGQQMIEMY
jgi:predicted aspartyl protease